MTTHRFTVWYERAENGAGYYAHVPALGLTTEGHNLKEVKAMARDAIAGYVKAAKMLGKRLPADVRTEQVEIGA